MSRRPHEDPSSDPPSKRPRKNVVSELSLSLPYTTTEFLQNITLNDKFVSVVCYVQNVNEIETVRTKDNSRDLLIFKFVLNNNNGSQISCVAWNQDATEFVRKIQINQILLIQNATAHEKFRSNDRNPLPFELLFKRCTKITNLGIFDFSETKNNSVEIKNFVDLADKHGWINVKGYVRDEFFVSNGVDKNYIGSITDGRFKLEVIVSNVVRISWQQGQPIEIFAEIQEYANSTLYLNVRDVDDIKVLDGAIMALGELLVVNEVIKRN